MGDSSQEIKTPAQELEINLVGLFRSILNRKLHFFSVMLICSLLGYLVFTVLPVRYEARVTFVFQDQSGGDSRLQQLAMLTGSMNMRSKGSPFVSHLETFSETREVTSQLKDLKFGDSTIQEILAGSRVDRGLKDSTNSFHSQILPLYKLTKKEDVFELVATHPNPKMAEFLAKNIYAKISALLEEKRRLGIRKKLEFIESLENGYKQQYEASSNRLKKFLMENNDISAPELMQKKGQIMFQLKLDEEKYLFSVKEREAFRIEFEQSEEPLVVIEDAYLPSSPAFPSLLKCLILAIVISLLINLILIGYLDKARWILVK